MIQAQAEVIPRTGLTFGFDAPVARHWFGDHPFKSRLFDAVSTMFPAGERFFMSSVRRYAKQIGDEQLKRDVDAFLVQEGQHSKLHAQLNRIAEAHGVDLMAMEKNSERLFAFLLARTPRRVTIAQTSAAEHLTALLAEFLLTHPEFMAKADPRVRALYTWHAVEEVEHKAVAFDVMQQSGEVPYVLRVGSLIVVTMAFQTRLFSRVESMLRSDGYTLAERAHIWREGLRWLAREQALYKTILRGWARYFSRDFHPWSGDAPDPMKRWLEVYNQSGDPLQASEALLGAVAQQPVS